MDCGRWTWMMVDCMITRTPTLPDGMSFLSEFDNDEQDLKNSLSQSGKEKNILMMDLGRISLLLLQHVPGQYLTQLALSPLLILTPPSLRATLQYLHPRNAIKLLLVDLFNPTPPHQQRH
jgi:hypothetical protein